MSLEIKHRPKKFKELAGNKNVVESITTILSRKKEDLPKSFLFYGERGCGKTTAARIVGKEIGCSEDELLEYNISNLKGIDTVRSVIENSVYSSISGNPKVYIFDEIHRQTKDAQNAFLKFLEEPPNNVYSILCTTNPEQLLPTIVSRCHSFQFKPLSPNEMMALLDSVLEKEHYDANEYPKEIKKEISRLSEGRPRDALKLLDAVIDLTDPDEIMQTLSSVSLDEANIKEICQALLNGKNWDLIRKDVQQLLKDNEAENVRRGVSGYMEKVLYNSKKNDKASMILDIFDRNTYDTGKPTVVNMFYVACQK